MKVLVLGASGYVGARLVHRMQAAGQDTLVCASRHATNGGLSLNTLDAAAMMHTLRQVDAVVNCVAGSARAIAEGARVLARAAAQTPVQSVVHLSSLAVYGAQEGVVNEASPLGPADGWYGLAKQEAEAHMRTLASQGVRVTALRLGCVWGAGSTLWTHRIAQWLAQGRLGDLGESGDGWTNGVAVDDVGEAIVRALHQPPESGPARVLNLAAPDSPRWNTWFTDLALAIGATPVRRIPPWQLKADACLLGPPLHALRRRVARWRLAEGLPDPISPGLLKLWKRQLRMDASAATRSLGLAWTPYPMALAESAASWRAQRTAPMEPQSA